MTIRADELLKVDSLRAAHKARLAAQAAEVATRAAVVTGEDRRSLPWILATLLRNEWVWATQALVEASARVASPVGKLTDLKSFDEWHDFYQSSWRLVKRWDEALSEAQRDGKLYGAAGTNLEDEAVTCDVAITKLLDVATAEATAKPVIVTGGES